jgi:putative FmdB family regulatory protein
VPTYQYACTECGHRFEQVQSFHDDALTHCPECDGRLRKVFNAVGVVFKGSGFYRTDSRAGSSASLAESASESSGSSGSEGDSSTTKAAPADKKPGSSTTKSDSSTSSSSSPAPSTS